MAGRLSFSIALNLLADNFKNGARSVGASLRGIQYQVLGMAAALGAGGLGLSGLVERMIHTARETNRVRTALRNVSTSTTEFINSQKFLIELSRQYGQDLNVLTGNFSKFSAAANSAGMSMADQEKIYTSITKATTAFGLSSEEANLSFLAITQMMAKGKISSEELRRQLGERMPIAMEAMARAAGVNIQQLDKMLKQGELYSKDILPKFADEMSKMLPNVNTDNIETSLGRLKTKFIEITEKMQIGPAYKKLIDGLTNGFEYVQDNFSKVVRQVVSVLTAVLITKGLKQVAAWYVIMGNRAEAFAIKGMKGAARLAAQTTFQANKMSNTLAFAAKKVGVAIKSALVTSGIGLAIMLLTNFVYKLWEAGKEAKAIKNTFKDYAKELKAINGGEEAEKLRSLLDIVNKRNKSQNTINSAQKELMRMLSVEKASQAELNELVGKRVKLLEASAKADFYARKKAETQDQIDTIMDKYGGEAATYRRYLRETASKGILNKFLGLTTQFERDFLLVEELRKVLAHADANLGEAVVSSIDSGGGPRGGDGEGVDGKETDLQKAEKKYTEGVKEISNKLKARAVTEEEYNKALDELNEKTREEIAGILGSSARNNKIYRAAEAGVLNPKIPKLTDFQKEEKEYKDKLTELTNLKDRGVLLDKEYQEELQELIISTLKATASLKDLGPEGLAFVESLKALRSTINTPVKEARDDTRDYSKSGSEILNDELSLQEKYVEAWKDLNEKTGLFDEQLREAVKDAKSLKEALTLAEIREDIKAYTEDLSDSTKDGVQAFYQLGKSIKSAFETLQDPDMTGFEKLLAMIEAISQTYDGIMTIVEAISAIEQASAALGLAKQAEAAVNTAATTSEISNIAAVSTAKVAADAAEATSSTAKSATVVTGLMTEQVAASALMAALSTAAYAGIPFAGAGLAAAQIATMKGLIAASAIPMFANGGIVPGTNFSGDNVLIRANSGEMILNQQQQAILFNKLKGRDSGNGSGGNVVFRIRGRELVGILEQESKRKD